MKNTGRLKVSDDLCLFFEPFAADFQKGLGFAATCLFDGGKDDLYVAALSKAKKRLKISDVLCPYIAPIVFNQLIYIDLLVRTERLELSHLSAPEPKSGAYTNFATSAQVGQLYRFCLFLQGFGRNS